MLTCTAWCVEMCKKLFFVVELLDIKPDLSEMKVEEEELDDGMLTFECDEGMLFLSSVPV